RAPAQYELIADNPIPTTGILAEDVTLEIITTDSDDNIVAALVMIEIADTDGTEGDANTSVDDLVDDVNNALGAAKAILDSLQLQAVDDGGNIRFEAMGHFVIEATSVNAGLLGLSVVEGGDAVASVVVLEGQPEEGYTATDAPSSNVLAGDVTLVFTFADGDLIVSVTIGADDTTDNSTLSDLLDDINKVLSSIGLDVQVTNDSGVMVFASDTQDIEITEDSVSADLLGLLDVAAGTPEISIRDPSLFELIAEDDLSTVGILADNIAFNVVMSIYDPNDDPYHLSPVLDEPDAVTGDRKDVIEGTVIIYRDDTLDNTGATDQESLNALVDDINDAFIRGGFREITAALDGSNRIYFSSARAFEIDVEHAVLRAEAEVTNVELDDNVTLDITIELSGGDYSGLVNIATDENRTSMEDLQEDVNQALIDGGFSDIKVRLVADYLEFYSRYDFTIEGSSVSTVNAEHLGLAAVSTGSDVSGIRKEPSSNAYIIGFTSVIDSAQIAERPPVTYRIIPVNSMVNGVLSEDITLDLSIDSGAYAGVVTIFASATNGVDAGTAANASLADLVTDITKALGETEIPGHPGVFFSSLISVQDERGVIVFVSEHDFTLVSEAGDNLDQLGFGVDTYNSALSTPDYEIEADDVLVASGILTVDVTLEISIDDGAGGTWETTVVIDNLETTTNTGVEDLLIDIENAFVAAEVLDGGIAAGSFASQFIKVESRSGKLVLAGAQEFIIDGDASINPDAIGLTSVGPGSDVVAAQPAPVQELFPYDEEEGERITLPASWGLVDDVALDLRVYDYPLPAIYPVPEYTVTIPAASTTNNSSIDDLIDDINAVLPAGVWALEEDGFIVFESDYHFQIEYKSENENLLGLTVMPHEDNIEANRSSNDGVLPDDVTFVLWVNLGLQKIVGEVTITAAQTAGNDVEGMIMDLVLDLQTALNTASYVNLDGDPYGNDPDEDFSNDPVTVGGVADPIVKVKLKNGKILFASQYYFQIFDSFSDPEVGDLQSVNAEILGLDTVADGTDVESSRPFNIIARAAGSEVIFGSEENSVEELYIAGSVLSDHQITLVEGPETDLDLDWPALLQTIDGPIILDLGENGFLKGDLIAGGDEGDVILTTHDTITVNSEILADRHVYIEAGFDPDITPSSNSVQISPTAWIRTSGPAATANYEVISSVNLPATGIIGANVTLSLEINDGFGSPWSKDVLINQSETTTNLGVDDLLSDIVNALAGVEVTEAAYPAGTYLNQLISVQNRGGKLVLSADIPFTILGDTSVNADQLGLTYVAPGSDVAADNEQMIWIDGYNEVSINGPIGSLQTDEPRTNGNVLVTSQNDNIIITEESGWIETNGRIVLLAANIDILGVIKNAGATAPEPAGDPAAENYEVVIDATGIITLTGDVDALGSILITTPNAITIVGSVEAGGVETFEFITEVRDFIDGGDERVRIAAPDITVDGGTGYDGADGTDEDVVPQISEGQSYSLGALIVASGFVQLVTPGGIDIHHASELFVRHNGGLLYLEAEYVDVLGSLYAGADPQRPTSEEPGVTWNSGSAGIEIQAVEMVTFGGDDTATDLDVALGNADAEGETIMRGGSAQATGTIDVTVTGGATPVFYLNELSFIKTDAVVIDEPTPGVSGHITIITDNGMEIVGVIQAVDPDSDVTLNSGTGLLEISGYVEAGDELILTGANNLSISEVSVFITKLFYETKTLMFVTTEDEARQFIIDEFGQPIDDYGFLLARDGDGKVVVDIDGNPVQLIGENGYAELGEGPVYITYDDSENPVLVDKEGYKLVEYAEIVAAGAVSPDGRLSANVTLDISLSDDDTGAAVSGSPVEILMSATSTNNDIGDLRDDINVALDAGAFADIEAIVRNNQIVFTVVGYDLVINYTSANADLLGLVDWQTDRRFLRVDEGGQFVNESRAVINAQGILLGVGGVLINEFGYLVDENGNFINADGNAINAYGQRIDPYGNIIAEDQVTLISDEGYRINEDGLLINGSDELLNGVGAIRTTLEIDSVSYLVDEYDNLVGDHGYLINQDENIINFRGELTDEQGVPLTSMELPVFGGHPIVADSAVVAHLTGLGLVGGTVIIDGIEYLTDASGNLVSDREFLIDEDGYIINEFGEFTNELGIVLGEGESPVPGGNRVLADPAGLEAPVFGGDPWEDGSIQPGPAPLARIGEMVLVDLPVRQSGGTLNTTGPAGAITITGNKAIEVHGMVGLVYMDDEALAPVSAVDVTEITIATPAEVYIRTDALVNAKDNITIEGINVWAMDESVTIARDDYSVVHLEATGSGPDDGKVYIARSQIYYFRALVAAQGMVELVGVDIGVFGTVIVGGELLNHIDPDPSLVNIIAEEDVQVRGEILSAGDVEITAGVEGVTVGNIAVSAEGKVSAGYNSMIAGDIIMTATGEVILLAFEDTMNDDLEFAPAYVTYEPVYVDVVTGYRRVEAGFVLRPVVHWIPTITTEQTGFDDVKVGSEFGSVETRLFQDGYYKTGFGMYDYEDAATVASAFLWSRDYPWIFPALNSLWYRLDPSTRQKFDYYTLGEEPSKALKKAIIADLNTMVEGELIYNEFAFASASLSGEAQYLLAKTSLTGAEQVRLNRVLIQDVLPGIKDLAKSDQFREYFIEGVDYRIADLDWPGEWDPSFDAIFVSWVGASGAWIYPDDMSDEAQIIRQIFEQVVTYEIPKGDPEVLYSQGAAVENTVSELLIGGAMPPLFVSLSPRQYYTEHTFIEVREMLHDVTAQGGKVYKEWGDLTATEKANAKMQYMGYKKLFDVQFISEFEKTVTVGQEEDDIWVVTSDIVLAAFENLSRQDAEEDGLTFVKNAGLFFATDSDDDGGASGSGGVTTSGAGGGTVLEQISSGRYAFAGDSAPTAEGLIYETTEGAKAFVPGVWVEDKFRVTAMAALDSILGSGVYSYTLTKKYFDFWFSEFIPFDPAIHFYPWEGIRFDTIEEAALAHFLPPNNMLDAAFAAVIEDLPPEIPPEFIEDGRIVFTAEEAADFAFIKGTNFEEDGEHMTAAVAQVIYNLIAGAVSSLADQFFIAGVDYDEDYSNPNRTSYIASFFEREDTILDDGDWYKIYSPTEGLGRINRNLEGIPTATFWELDFTGQVRDVVPYKLDDGSDIFLRVPVDWWENYEMTTLGNVRTDPDQKKLQYVGNIDTYDETVGYVRNVAQMDYTQSWSANYWEDLPSNPDPGDWHVTWDNDNSPAGWVVTYREDPHPDWPDEYTAFTQYSIFDGREISPAEPYGDLFSYYWGAVELAYFEGMEAAGGGGVDDLLFVFDWEIEEDLVYAVIEVDNSVKVEWTPDDWNLDVAGQITPDGTLYWRDKYGNIKLTNWGAADRDQSTTVGSSSGFGIFEGNNWNFGYDNLGNKVFAQYSPGDEILNVAANGVRLEEIAAENYWIADVGMHEQWTYPYYQLNYGLYTWDQANANAPAYGHLAIIDNADENQALADWIDVDVWLGGYAVSGKSHETWTSFKWIDGTTVYRWGPEYSNFHPNEPNDLNDEDYLMMWENGWWNDIYPSAQLAALYEVESHWGPVDYKGETQTNYVYKLKTKWEAIEDVRSDITYRVFTDAHDIVDKRPRYETLTSEVPVIKMEQVTNWEFIPVVEQQLDWSGSVVTPDGPLDLSAFDLDTLTATGTITINAKNDVLVKASMDAYGADSAISIASEEGNVTVGDDMPVDPMIYDMVNLSATKALEITADGDIQIGETATLVTTSKDTPEPDETDIAITATEGSVTVAGEIHARHSAEINAGTDVTVTGIITAANSTIEISAGEGAGGNGSIIVHHIPGGDPADELDENNERPSLGGILAANGEDGQIHLRTGANSGDISLLDANIEAAAVTLEAPAGTVIQSSGFEPAGEDDPPSTGGIISATTLVINSYGEITVEGEDDPPSTGGIISATTLVINSYGEITVENMSAEDITAVVSGPGGIEIYNIGFFGETPEWPSLVTLTNIETADGAITIETLTENLVITSVSSLTDSDDNDITITA
ncbi:MAG: hypothetical protein AMJ79_09910, partial [Phycisphaerae bacterium SM23_30]